jgi:hypothetical protein
MNVRDEMLASMVKLIAAVANVPEDHPDVTSAARRICEHIDVEGLTIRHMEQQRKMLQSKS